MDLDNRDSSLLTSVRVVCRSDAQVYALDHVLQQLDALLFPSRRLTLSKSVRHCSARLFTRVLASLGNDKARSKFEKLQQIRLAMRAAARLGQLWMVRQLHERHPAALNGATALAAGESGERVLIQWVYGTKRHLLGVNFYAAVYKAFEASASRGHLQTVQWLVQSFPTVMFDVSIPAKEGHLEVAKWVLARGRYRCSVNVADDVAGRGDLAMMQFVVEHALVDGQSSAPDLAAEFGHFALWLYENCGERCSPAAMSGAAKNCHLDVTKWLYEFCGLQFPPYAMMNAFATGDFEMLEFLQSARQWDRHFVAAARTVAAKNHQTEVMQWLAENYSEVR
ncbi:hypothetical protein PHYPSEUDO_006586 [Phytophthora pseudosyringae]|uniref:Ankyrin repeat-containing domain n=1 Tax=Phytophthora pseudosyringae TaxID=221518 RepID=A0A8T1VL62_9STRA|nr:hypothetical protein PHYPSEUDO_006586 [Phytophthora pseudosyringae]